MGLLAMVDNIQFFTCPRCGGDGVYKNHSSLGHTCFKCFGSGVLAKSPKNQPKITTTARLDDALVGDIIQSSGAYFRVECVTWDLSRGRYNQRIDLARVVDDRPMTAYRMVCFMPRTPCSWRIEHDNEGNDIWIPTKIGMKPPVIMDGRIAEWNGDDWVIEYPEDLNAAS